VIELTLLTPHSPRLSMNACSLGSISLRHYHSSAVQCIAVYRGHAQRTLFRQDCVSSATVIPQRLYLYL
jgi:oxalate decarboxylase/phosphoglucose isomerase-like protein (cupin superfamily)